MTVEVERTSSIGSDSSNNNNLKPTPTHHHPNGTSFRNPWPSSSSSPSSVGLNQLFNGSIRIEMARRIESDVEPIRTVESQLESFYKDGDVNDDGCGLVGTWIGHAGFLIQLPDLKTEDLKGGSIRIRLLFDPIFSNRAGPNQFIGTRRFQSAPPFKLKNLPRIDYCLISHNHYDHLDYETIKQLYKYQPQINYFVPLGLKAWFNSVPIPSSRVVELDWWESFDPLRGLVSNSKLKATLVYVSRKEIPERCDDDGEDSLIISCVPAQHSSGQTLLDQNSSLWCGWVVKKSRQPSCASSVVMDRVKVYDERLVKNDKDDRVANEKVKDCTIYFAGYVF
ncbi:beta-lactamase superfamily domain-domain-containing protein [Phakopsora pachyrhizi]|uniref:Beta-lactamase superfamily domain-domain-containing protein n=1 Tax=Phakopsora pachyrhizi TaxID=170000 RepID=A0AAV0B8L7_PHAPC|nr:beta-lactamase superfamily domain-domain-containing protein [Phakopsora pachyrhizi]